jgi:hypothetical protein
VLFFKGTLKGEVNRAYLCPRCGETWAKVSFGSNEWRAITRSCPSHSWHSLDKPGSILVDWRIDLLALERSAIEYEFALALGSVPIETVFVDPLGGFNPLG